VTGAAGYIEALEDTLGRKAERNDLPMHPGDVPATSANTDGLHAWVGFKPARPGREGVRRFVQRYHEYYRL
jgi:UDP-glucuronate 4-epimerase